MQFVTISDHNRIEGALAIAHLPGTFISSEITTYFPEDGCKIHCLVTGISEQQFHTIQELPPKTSTSSATICSPRTSFIPLPTPCSA